MKIRFNAMRMLAAMFCAAFLVWATNGFCSNELDERDLIRGAVSQLVVNGEYAKLEELVDDYRKNRSRTPSGVWKLTIFHSAIHDLFSSRRKEEKFWVTADYYAQNWLKAYPESAAAHLAYANMLFNRGWSYRGHGPSSSVDPQSWKPFNEYTDKARDYLEKNKAIASGNPHWYVLMALIARQQSWPEADFVKVIDEGLKLEPGYYQLYFSALDYYTPKWGGSAVEIERFATRAVERTRSSEGAGMYARIYWYASQIQYGDRLFVDSIVNWSMMKTGMDDVLKKYPDDWNINNFALFACMSQDKAKTAELMGRIKGPPMMEVWRAPEVIQHCRSWALQK